MGNLQESSDQNLPPLKYNINDQDQKTTLINNQQQNQEEINIDIINKDKVLVKIPTNNNIWQKEYYKNDLIGTVINDYLIENNIKYSVGFLNNLTFEDRELNLKDEINSLLNSNNNSFDESEKDKYIELIAKPFSNPFEIYCFSKNNKTFKIIRFTNELKENKKINNFSSSSAYCNGFNHLYISGGENSQNYFWEINLKMNIINHPILIPPKQYHSMIYIPKYIIFIVGGNDLNTFYYHIKEKRILNWGKLNIKRIEPALQVIQNKLYCIDSLNSFSDKNNYTIEVTDINSNEGKWNIIRPRIPLNMIFSHQLFGVSKDKDNNIIFLGGSLNKSDNDMNYMYNIRDNSIDNSNVKYLNFNLKEKTFIQINRKYECILPDFDRTSPQLVFYNKKKGKTELINFSPNINNSKIFEVVSPLNTMDKNKSANILDDSSSSSYVTFKKNLNNIPNKLSNIYESGISKKNTETRVNGVSPNVSFWEKDKNNMNNASQNISLLNNYGDKNKTIISNNSSLFKNKVNILSSISPNSSFVKNFGNSNSPSFSSSKNIKVKGVSSNVSFWEGDSNNNKDKYDINLKRSKYSNNIPFINKNKSIDNSYNNGVKRIKNNNGKICGVSPNVSLWEDGLNKNNNKYDINSKRNRTSKMTIINNNTNIDIKDINSIKSKKNNNGKVNGVSPNLSFWEGEPRDPSIINNKYNINLKRNRTSKMLIVNNKESFENNDIYSVKRKNNNRGSVCGVSPNLSFWEGDSNNNRNISEINLEKKRASKMPIINNNENIYFSKINSKKKNNNNGKVYGVSPNLSFWEGDSNNNNKYENNIQRDRDSKIPFINNDKSIDNGDINSVNRKKNNNDKVYGVSPNLSFWESDSNNNNKYDNNLKGSRNSKMPIINNNKSMDTTAINSIKRKNNNKGSVCGVSPNLSFWEGDSNNNRNKYYINLKRNKTSIIPFANDNERIYNSQINSPNRKNNIKGNVYGVSPNLSFWEGDSQNLNRSEIIAPKRNINKAFIKINNEDNNNNDVIPNGQKVNKVNGVSPNLSFWSNDNLNENEIIPLKSNPNLYIKNNIEDNNNSNNSLIIKDRKINKVISVAPNLSFWESNENKNNNNNNDKPILYKTNVKENNKAIYNNTQIKNNDKFKNNKYKSSYINGAFPKVGFWSNDKDINNNSFNNKNEGEKNPYQIYGDNNNYDKKINNLRKPIKNNESLVIIRDHIFN